jgi:hypothetical protein
MTKLCRHFPSIADSGVRAGAGFSHFQLTPPHILTHQPELTTPELLRFGFQSDMQVNNATTAGTPEILVPVFGLSIEGAGAKCELSRPFRGATIS